MMSSARKNWVKAAEASSNETSIPVNELFNLDIFVHLKRGKIWRGLQKELYQFIEGHAGTLLGRVALLTL